MNMFRHLLLATDLLSESQAAAAGAVEIARAENAKVTVLYVMQTLADVYPQFTPPIDIVATDSKIRDAASRELEAWVKKNLAGVGEVELELRSGDAAEVICDVARERKATTIVMATHGRKGLRRMVLGSVTEHVLRDAPCPVLVVPPTRA